MLVNFNPQAGNNQNFGMAIHSNEAVDKLLMSRIKSKAVLNQLSDIVNTQADNKLVDINLFVNPDGKSLSANVVSNDTKNFLCKSYSENFFSSLFGGPLGFIKKLSKIAKKEADKLAKADLNYDDVFNKMK